MLSNVTARQSEVIVVGGGPAGATVAALLAQRGRAVTLIERDAFPRFQIGESLLPKSCRVFERLGIMARLDGQFVRKYGARFICAETGRENRYRFAEAFDAQHAYAFEVTRADFDALLLERARELGVQVRQPCKVDEVIFDGERAVGARCDGERLHAQVVVDATGRGSLLASRFGMKRRLDGLDHGAVFAHFRGKPLWDGDARGDITILMGPRGWAWVIPFVGEHASIGIVMDKEWLAERGGRSMEAFFEESLAGWGCGVELLRTFAREGPVRSAANFSYEVSRVVGDGWLCVGDAFGFIDPLFSSGAHMALGGAWLAAEAIDDALTAGDVGAARFAGYVRQNRAASDLFLGVVRATYRGEFRQMLFEQRQRAMLRKVITSLLSGDVFHPDPAPTWVRFVRGRFPAR